MGEIREGIKEFIATWRKREWADVEALEIFWISMFVIIYLGGAIMLFIAIYNSIHN